MSATAASVQSSFSNSEQVAILLQILHQETKLNTKCNELILIAINEIESSNEQADTKLIYAKKRITQLIAELEDHSHGQPTLSRLDRAGLNKFLFRNAQLKGIELPEDDGLKILLKSGFIGVAISALFIALFIATSFMAAPAWLSVIATGLFTGSATYLSGIIYGVVNDIFATNMNLPYFLLGHQPQQKSLLKTNDPIAQGIAWGVAATFGPVVAASVVFAVIGSITAAFVPLATFTLPIIMLAMPLIAAGAEFYAKQRVVEIPQEQDVNLILYYTNLYQRKGLEFMCPTSKEKAAWFANSDRNVFGFFKVPFIGAGALVLLVGLSAASGLLPAALFSSSLLSVVLPASFAMIGVVTLSAAGIYMHANKDTQLDNRYKLHWGTEKPDNNLFFEESDIPFANQLIQEYNERVTPSVIPHVSSNTTAPEFDLISKSLLPYQRHQETITPRSTAQDVDSTVGGVEGNRHAI